MYKKFAELLSKFNKTAYQVSKDTGIAQSILSEWKSGRIKILGADKLKILADYFGVDVYKRQPSIGSWDTSCMALIIRSHIRR